MTKIAISPLSACPINFAAFETLNQITGNIDATLLLSKLNFHQFGSKIEKNGKKYITRTRQTIANWFGFSLKKIDRLLAMLEDQQAIERQSGLWYGQRATFISVTEDICTVPINMRLFDAIQEKTGSTKAAILFSKILYSFSNSKITHEDLTWSTIKKEQLAKWAGLSLRTTDKLLTGLETSGLILKKNFNWRGRPQTHFHVPSFVIEQFSLTVATRASKIAVQQPAEKALTPIVVKIPSNGTIAITPTPIITTETDLASVTNEEQNTLQSQLSTETPGQNCRPQPAKTTTSIIIRTKQKKTNNNTAPMLSTASLVVPTTNLSRDITFQTIGDSLTQRQQNYLQSALNNTIQRNKLKLSSPKTLLAELEFSILNPEQRQGVTSFGHAVSRFLKIVADNHWRTPIGFYNHCAIGQSIKEQKQAAESNWQAEKAVENEAARQSKFSFAQLFNFNPAKQRKKDLTESALSVAKRIKDLLPKAKETKDSTLFSHIDNLIEHINNLFQQGADKQKVACYLQGNC